PRPHRHAATAARTGSAQVRRSVRSGGPAVTTVARRTQQTLEQPAEDAAAAHAAGQMLPDVPLVGVLVLLEFRQRVTPRGAERRLVGPVGGGRPRVAAIDGGQDIAG